MSLDSSMTRVNPLNTNPSSSGETPELVTLTNSCRKICQRQLLKPIGIIDLDRLEVRPAKP